MPKPYSKRDDFSPDTKRRLALRAGHRCSFPDCGAQTVGPSDEANDAVNNVGVAAHIAGAARGARRYDPRMTKRQRSSIENGIWLCQTHAKLIDGDEANWTVELLNTIRSAAEERAKGRLGRQDTNDQKLSALRVEAGVCVYIKSYRAAYVEVLLVNEGRKPVTIKAVRLRLDKQTLVPGKPRENLVLSGCDWLVPGPLRLKASDALLGAWYFGWSFGGGGQHVDAKPGDAAVLTLTPVAGPETTVTLGFIHPDDPPSTVSPERSALTGAAPETRAVEDLLRKIHAKTEPLSASISEALALARRVGNSDLETFCRDELGGYYGRTLDKRDPMFPRHRVVKAYCSPWARLNFSGFDTPEAALDLLAASEEFHPYTAVKAEPISEFESKTMSADQTRKSIMKWEAPISDVVPGWKSLNVPGGHPVVFYARGDTPARIVEATRAELTRRLLDLLPAAPIPVK